MKTPMKTPVKKVRDSHWHIIVALQTILMIGVIIWAITQKVEAEKQKVLAIEAKSKAEKAQENAKMSEYQALKEKDNALEYQRKYQELLHQKK